METNNQDLLQQLFHLEWLLRRSHMRHHRDMGPMGTPYQGQGRILSLLKLKPEISQKELSKILDIRSQSLGELLAKLERAGFITRTPSAVDRRGMDIRLTEAGRAASDQEDDEPKTLESFFDCLNTAEQATLRDYLERLIQSLEKQMAEGDPERGIRPGHDFHGRGFGRHLGREHGQFHGDFRGFGHFFGRDDPRSAAHDQETNPAPKSED